MTYTPGEILLEKYRVEALIGQGAFGEVYRVTHLSLNVPRALKVLRRDTPGVGSTE
jgi:eukaryotic-like serine/threonine-protein kinase